MALENTARRASPTRTTARPSSSQGSAADSEICLTGDGMGGVAAGGRSPSSQQQRSPSHSVRRKPRASPHRYHGSHSNGCASATASPLRDASVSRSQSMRTTRRPHSLQRHFRDRIASIPGDLLMVNGANDSRGSSSSSLPCDDPATDVQRLRNFAVTSKGVVNRGDSFRSKSRSTHSVASNGSGHKLAVPCSSDAGGDATSEAYCVCASLDGDRRVVSSLQQLSAEPAVRTDRATFALACLEQSGPSLSGLPPEVVVTKSADAADLARYRILVLGARDVGKTSLINQFMTSEYIYAHDCSVDEENEKSVMVVLNGEESELTFIEHVHQDELLQHARHPCQALRSPPTGFNPAAMYRPDAYLVVYNICSRSSFKIAKEYLSLIHRWDNVDHKAVIMVGHKTDLVRTRAVTTDDGRYLATNERVKFIETSTCINHQVDELLAGLLHQIRLKNQISYKDSCKRDSVRMRGRNSSCTSSFSGCKAKVFLKRFLRKACSRSRSCDDLHVL
ncbi:uncharacterized protein LOC142565330 [Dermacentor variabilis]|uniref:uncharacterized protein LOC142565330 n=1 Tax=Dermacentor variabilis TaxID=34621 RepID=UPI003F5C0D8C